MKSKHELLSDLVGKRVMIGTGAVGYTVLVLDAPYPPSSFESTIKEVANQLIHVVTKWRDPTRYGESWIDMAWIAEVQRNVPDK
jgi:hypothetical protein